MDVLRQRPWRRAALAAAVVLLTGAITLTAVDLCGPWPERAPRVVRTAHGRGALRAGAASVPLTAELPSTVAGYPPLRAMATRLAAPLFARATVLEVGGERVSLVTLDTLLVTARMRAAVQEGHEGPVWLLASHSHSSVGGYDPRPVAQVAALGVYDAKAEAALVTAARAALAGAQAALGPAHLEVGRGAVEGLTVPRSGDEVDRRLTVVRFLAGSTEAVETSGAGARVLAQWVVFSAHPTLAAREAAALDPDWPGRLGQLAVPPVTLVLQGAGGNASVNRSAAAQPQVFAERLTEHLAAAAPRPADSGALAWAEVELALPHPDGARLLPGPLTRAAENALCFRQEHDARVAVLRLGPLSLLLTTVEPSAAAGLELERRAGVERVLGLANGYHGYLETPEAVRSRAGEARLQYFPADFALRLAEAAALAGQVASTSDVTGGPATLR